MTLKARLVRAMLLALALAAGAGVLSVFVPGADLFVRVGATCVVTAIVIGLSLRSVSTLDGNKPSRAALVALCGLVGAYIMAVSGIWVSWLNENIGLSLTLSSPVFLIFGAILGAAIRLQERKVSEVSAKLSLVLVSASALAFLIAAWGPAYAAMGITAPPEFALDTAGTGWVILLFAAASGCCLLGVGVDRHHWRLFGVLGALVAAVLAIASIWTQQPVAPSIALQCGIIAVVLSHANLMIRCVLPDAWKPVLHLAIGAAALAAACASYLNATIPFDMLGESQWNLPGKLLGASVIIAGCATLGAIILQRANARSSNPVVESPSRYTSIKVECPRCATAQAAPVGTSGCINCGLLLTIQVSTPCCAACGYVTLDLKSPTCPECGASLNAKGSLLA